ncbi:hypothetical protein FH608_020920 [Nonomuraea phyllanthi]|uniref:Uncharacterized protein n=1 Tax=Nonomuraea phyllanthi TaxID=2219224 RepID=A0A5C4WHH2_9ACTN|nr:hypothetical protein [Nonomuraea phyllanthi]KAB8193679.1 hypothetical protein FH608_020920 [Nonomuraea phyllanthi]QFY12419.1 hypothetical protein GBF35_42820 [Nonomuraea phyllanthi]
MYRSGLILAGLVGGMVMFGGSALAATPSVTAAPAYTGILPGPSSDAPPTWDFGEWNNFGHDDDVVDLDLLNQLLSRVLSG